jgi:hypothetical protein
MRREPALSEVEGNLLFGGIGMKQVFRFARNDKKGAVPFDGPYPKWG